MKKSTESDAKMIQVIKLEDKDIKMVNVNYSFSSRSQRKDWEW